MLITVRDLNEGFTCSTSTWETEAFNCKNIMKKIPEEDNDCVGDVTSLSIIAEIHHFIIFLHEYIAAIRENGNIQNNVIAYRLSGMYQNWIKFVEKYPLGNC